MTLALRDSATADSPPARWDARWKLAALLLAAFGAAALRSPITAGIACLIGLALALLGRVPARVVAGRVGLLLFAVLPFLVFIPLTAGGDGLFAAGALALRVLAIGLFALVLVRTTPLSRTLAAAHALRVPGVLVQVAQLAYRYTFLLAAEFRRLRVALRARGFRPRTDRHTYRTVGRAVGSLLVRGGDRAERVADAMRCRGFDGTFHALARFRTTPADVFAALLVAAATIALVLVDRLVL
jgi:cobalt/nickel transport system permease protein